MLEIIQTNALSPDSLQKLNSLIALCDGYEPFLDCDTLYYLAFDTALPDILIGFLSYINTDLSDGTSEIRETEITALVHPDWRRQGVFTALLNKACKNLKSAPDKNSFSNRTNPIVAALPEYLTGSHICKGLAYSELLLKCEPTELPVVFNNIPADHEDYEGFLSDDCTEFLLYYREEDEPCAVCSLDYCEAYTNIYGVYVDEDQRHKGIGTLLMQQLLTDYFSEFKLPLILNVKSTNTAAVKLYKKCGFKEDSRIDYYSL